MADWAATDALSGSLKSGMVGAEAAGLEAVCDILSQAFADDPMLRWFNSDPGFVPAFFRMILPGFLEKGFTYMDHQQTGAASWVAPHDQARTPFTLASVISMIRLCGVRGTYRLASGGMRISRYHPREPHYYLFAIGALPGCQGQGVGSALMRHMLRRCDSERMPAYLENSRRANLEFYRGHGFEVRRKIQLGRDSPPLWLMWREPRAATLSPAR